MPLRKKYAKRRTYRKRRFIRRRRTIRRYKSIYNRPQFYKESKQNVVSLTTDASGNAFQARYWLLSDCSNYSGVWSALFDQYKLRKVVIKIWPNYSEAQSGTGRLVQIHSALDFDDDTTPTSISQLGQYNNYRQTFALATRPHIRVIYPKYKQLINEVDTGAAMYRPVQGKIDIAYPDVKHHGFKWAIGNGSATTTYDFRVQEIYYLTMYNTR